VLVIVSCGGGGSSSPTAGTGTGTLELGLTDAASGDYQAIYITIAEVQVKRQGAVEGETGWETVVMPGQTYNLLELVNGVIVTLGVGELEAGQYGQMRLLLGDLPETPALNILDDPHPYANYLIDAEDNAIELKVPSGYQSGIKIVRGFTIAAAQATELILDFDAVKSVVQAGKSGKWLLKPTIKVLETVENFVSGVVSYGIDPLENALVSAQIYDPEAADPKDEVILAATSLSTAEGAYKMFLPPDIYNIVAAKAGYLPACQEIEAQFFEEYVVYFSLVAETGTITIEGTVSGMAAAEDSAYLSIRQTMDCGSGAAAVEVASVRVAEGGSYSIILPAGTYELVASAAGYPTKVFHDLNADTEQDIVFGL